jgi:dTMP kinase
VNTPFLVIEGPNGVGKSTTATLLAEVMAGRGVAVEATREPSGSPLGRLVRSSEQHLHGRALALAVAADRYAHIDTVIAPALAAGRTVVSDRYVPSSLVLQHIDGLDLDEIWSYNQHTLVPDATIYLVDTPEVISERIATRSTHSRFEQSSNAATELRFYDEAAEFLHTHGWPQIRIDCHGKTATQVVDAIIDSAVTPTA